MPNKLYPNKTADSVLDITAEFLTKKGIKGIIFDIDNTLAAHTEETAPQNIKQYLSNLKKSGIKTAIVSNNKKERVKKFCDGLTDIYVYRAYKPFKKHLKRVQSSFMLNPDEICLVGDQIFTDIFGGNRIGFYTVLVTALGENETGFVAFKRLFEKAVMHKYKKEKEKL